MTGDLTGGTGSPGLAQYIVYAPAPLLQKVIAYLEADPGVKILSVGGPATAPERIVVQMAESTGEQLRQVFGDQVTVEPDQPLTAYS
jgi:hypothetical protein